MIFIYAKTFFQVDVGIARSEALNINTISTLALLLLTVAAGALSDRIGRKPLLIASAASMIVFAYPLFWLMDHPDFSVILAGQLGFALIVGAFAGVAPATMAEMLPGCVRVSGTSMGFNLCMALFGGTTPLVAIYLIKLTGMDLAPAFYLIATAAVSLSVIVGLRETSKAQLG